MVTGYGCHGAPEQRLLYEYIKKKLRFVTIGFFALLVTASLPASSDRTCQIQYGVCVSAAAVGIGMSGVGCGTKATPGVSRKSSSRKNAFSGRGFAHRNQAAPVVSYDSAAPPIGGLTGSSGSDVLLCDSLQTTQAPACCSWWCWAQGFRTLLTYVL